TLGCLDRSRMDSKWIEWARRLQAIAQNGLTFSRDPFDRERYEEVRSIAEAIVAYHSGLDDAPIHDLLRGEQGYATPKIDVRGAVFHENRLLLVREKSDGLWTLPGGWEDRKSTRLNSSHVSISYAVFCLK